MPHIPPFQPDRRLFPFESRWLETEVGPVHYIDEGEGEPILFLHGNPTWSFLYRGIVIRLRKKYRCIAVDYPGFGLSARPEDYGYTPAEHADVVATLVRHLDLRRLTIMGHDWGGPIGMRVALDETSRLRALVMGDTWYWPPDAWQLKAWAYVMASAPVQTQIIRRNILVERLMPYGVKFPLADEVMHHYREALPTPKSRIGAAEFPRQMMEASLWLGDLADQVHERLTNVPLLLTWGIGDHLYPMTLMQHFREDFRLTTIRRLDARHFIQEDAPGEIAEAIEEFLTTAAA
ncbi:MAG: alpha/beta fold hydrolase [Gemmatimonadetes bacterium]|nr:alpha/beta fold hydrolase [Gemmatimonadota bacterium]